MAAEEQKLDKVEVKMHRKAVELAAAVAAVEEHKLNAVEAKKLIDESGLEVHSDILLQEAADKVAEVLA